MTTRGGFCRPSASKKGILQPVFPLLAATDHSTALAGLEMHFFSVWSGFLAYSLNSDTEDSVLAHQG